MTTCQGQRSVPGVPCVAQPSSELDLSTSKCGEGAGFSSSLITGSLVKSTGPYSAALNHRGQEVDLERVVCLVLGD